MRISNILWRYNFSLMKGKFIVFEGLDRSGKSSLCKLLHERLSSAQKNVCAIGYPNRSSPTGIMINDYLSNKSEICHEAVHLLFSANRWEAKKQVQQNLNKGFDVICDRYWYSGVAYSFAKGLDLDWCMAADNGLTEPDLVIYLKADPTKLSKRSGYGNQRFQKIEFQQKVAEGYQKLVSLLKKDNIKVLQIDDKSLQQVKQQVFKLIDHHFDRTSK